MLKTDPNTSDVSRLVWKSHWGYQVANDSRCLYMRESGGSMVAALVFSVAIASSAGWLGLSVFFVQETIPEKAFRVFMLFVAAVFIYIPWLTLRKGRWMIVYDRGEPGTTGEIRYSGKRLPVEKVRSLSTRNVGGSPPRSIVVAEFHDGTHEVLGPCGISTWPAYYAQQGTAWMGLPFRPSAS